MPIHDWTRIAGGGFHAFHQDWTIEISRTLNRGLLPEGLSAFPESSAKQIRKAESENAIYARKANRIAIRHAYGHVVAIIEIVSPGNKDSKHALESFVTKAVEFLRNGVHLLLVDLFPPTSRDPEGLHHVIWSEITDQPFEPRPADKPLTIASYNAWPDVTAYVDPVAVGDELPDAPLFLSSDRYVNVPLEATYQASWNAAPRFIRDRVAPGP